uniref:Uncharacterized protein n=1 Tax=Rhizophagus irregularis (strain DAOM 181602 / DAOM 197198 / MUCL 43194) TaxID=747089 RepID=U9UJG2_RHIID
MIIPINKNFTTFITLVRVVGPSGMTRRGSFVRSTKGDNFTIAAVWTQNLGEKSGKSFTEVTRLESKRKIRKEQSNFLRTCLSPRPLEFFKRIRKALKDEPNSENLLEMERKYNNDEFKDGWSLYDD